MTHFSGPALVIDDGGVAALVACCLATEPSRVTPFAAPPAGPGAGSRIDASLRRADLLGMSKAIVRSAGDTPSEDPFAETTALLLDAGRQGVRMGVGVVIWPVHLGIDVDAMERELARARLVERLVSLDAPGGLDSPSLRIETPLLDLGDDQLGALARDLDAPLDTAWWCVNGGAAPCGRCGSCRRWESALNTPSGSGGGVGAQRKNG
jgi:hypothetical protein